MNILSNIFVLVYIIFPIPFCLRWGRGLKKYLGFLPVTVYVVTFAISTLFRYDSDLGFILSLFYGALPLLVAIYSTFLFESHEKTIEEYKIAKFEEEYEKEKLAQKIPDKFEIKLTKNKWDKLT